jgi:hypothetical protein
VSFNEVPNWNPGVRGITSLRLSYQDRPRPKVAS